MEYKGKEVVNLIEDDDDDVRVLHTSTVLLEKKGSNSRNPFLVRSFPDTPVPEAKGSSSKSENFIDLTQDFDDDDDVQVLFSFKKGTKRKLFRGESSSSQSKRNRFDGILHNFLVDDAFTCDICVDEKPNSELFYIKGCTHFYCSECIAKYVASKLQENIINIPCPVLGCNGRLEPEYCRSILPSQVFDRWGDALCEALILDSEKFYCPYEDCSALLIRGAEEDITDSECPNCRRWFCARCKVPWHSQMSCEAFQKSKENDTGREDIMLMDLAERRKWRRCPNCRFYVEKIWGCSSIRCRCGFNFCYACGEGYGPLGHNCRTFDLINHEFLEMTRNQAHVVNPQPQGANFARILPPPPVLHDPLFLELVQHYVELQQRMPRRR